MSLLPRLKSYQPRNSRRIVVLSGPSSSMRASGQPPPFPDNALISTLRMEHCVSTAPSSSSTCRRTFSSVALRASYSGITMSTLNTPYAIIYSPCIVVCLHSSFKLRKFYFTRVPSKCTIGVTAGMNDMVRGISCTLAIYSPLLAS